MYKYKKSYITLFIHPLSYSITRFVLHAYFMPGPVLHAGNITVSKLNVVLTFMGIYRLLER